MLKCYLGDLMNPGLDTRRLDVTKDVWPISIRNELTEDPQSEFPLYGILFLVKTEAAPETPGNLKPLLTSLDLSRQGPHAHAPR